MPYEDFQAKLIERLRFYPRPDSKAYLPFLVDEKILGWLRPDFINDLLKDEEALLCEKGVVTFHSRFTDSRIRSEAMADLLQRKKILIPGWRNELFPVMTKWGEEPMFFIERAAAPLFGILAFGVNLIGYIKKADGLYFWLGRRALQKQVAPGALDVTAGGGLPAGLSIRENLSKEAQEEAGIPPSLMDRVESIGHISFALETEIGLRREYQFNFALELPGDFRPKPVDGEVSEFLLLHQDELIAQLQGSDLFIVDTVFVLTDFFLQRKLVNWQAQKNVSLQNLLRQPIDLC